MIVADTCLVFHLFNETSFTHYAQKILEKDSFWFLPPLWREEYANVLSKLAKKEKHSLEKVIEHFNYTVEQLKNGEVYVETKKALKSSIENDISVYDAHFVVLALDFNVPLITQDKEILKKCPNHSQSFESFLK